MARTARPETSKHACAAGRTPGAAARSRRGFDVLVQSVLTSCESDMRRFFLTEAPGTEAGGGRVVSDTYSWRSMMHRFNNGGYAVNIVGPQRWRMFTWLVLASGALPRQTDRSSAFLTHKALEVEVAPQCLASLRFGMSNPSVV